jgi:hypothetical protein
MVRERISDGDIVRHFKREFVDTAKFDDAMYLYVVLSMNAMDTTNGGRVVVYKALYGDNKIFVRPYEDFMGEVDKEKYPNVKQKYRFERIFQSA